MKPKFPVARLIQNRSKELSLSPAALGFRLGYQNPVKAAGRVHSLCEGHLKNKKSVAALARLAQALEMPDKVVQQALAAPKKLIAELEHQAEEQDRLVRKAREARWRADFKPHAVIITERRIASQITFCALAGGPETLLIIPFDLSQSPITFVGQAVACLPKKAPLGANGRRCVPFFGEPLGLIINYSPDRALHCDREGNPIEWLPAAYRVGHIELILGSRVKSHQTVAHVLGV